MQPAAGHGIDCLGVYAKQRVQLLTGVAAVASALQPVCVWSSLRQGMFCFSAASAQAA